MADQYENPDDLPATDRSLPVTTLNFGGDQFLVLPEDKKHRYIANCASSADAEYIARLWNEAIDKNT